MEKRSALAVMLKAPLPGLVKTRLVPPLTHAEAARLYGCFIEDIFAGLRGLSRADVFAALSPDAGSPGEPMLPPCKGVFMQEGGDLGERIVNVFRRLFASGYANVAVIGSDSPDLPLEYIEEAFALLERTDAGLVLGPAVDGGYYLIGLPAVARRYEGLFEGIRWSTGSVLDETLERARSLSLRVEMLRPWHDIDTGEDLGLLIDNAAAPSSSACVREFRIKPPLKPHGAFHRK
jgi:rSAM/selenodomain-associated transferase 1